MSAGGHDYHQRQRVKITRHTKPPIQVFRLPKARFDPVQIDIIGLLPPSHSAQYILTCVDWYNRWPEAFPLQDITAATVASTCFSGWISLFSCPSVALLPVTVKLNTTCSASWQTFLVSVTSTRWPIISLPMVW